MFVFSSDMKHLELIQQLRLVITIIYKAVFAWYISESSIVCLLRTVLVGWTGVVFAVTRNLGPAARQDGTLSSDTAPAKPEEHAAAKP